MEIDLDLRVKLFKEYLENGGYEKIWFVDLLKGLLEVKSLPNGKVDPNTVNPIVNAAMLAYEGTQLMEPYLSDTHLSQYETLLQKSIFFDQINIETEAEFDEIFDKYNNRTDILFRGLNEAKYRLYSSMQRFWINNKLYEGKKSFENFLEDLIKNVKTVHGGVITRYFKNSSFDSDNDVAILSYLQHYSCPTPLLDWTYSFSNALYFASSSVEISKTKWEIDNYFCVYFLEEEHLQNSSLKDITIKGLKNHQEEFKTTFFEKLRSNGLSDEIINQTYTDDLIEKMFISMHGSSAINFMSKIKRLLDSPILYFSDIKDDSPIKYCLNNNLNIVNQQGAFTWNSHPTKPLEHIANEVYKTEKDNSIYRFSECININKNLVPYVTTKLISLGVTKDFIYPDPYYIANAAFSNTLSEEL